MISVNKPEDVYIPMYDVYNTRWRISGKVVEELESKSHFIIIGYFSYIYFRNSVLRMQI